MGIADAFRLALHALRAQKLKSLCALVGVLIGVMFLIAVVAIVRGMNDFMQERFANGLIGVNSFEVRRMPAIAENVPEDVLRAWLRRPRIDYREAAFLKERVRTPTVWARACFAEMPVRHSTLRGTVEVRAVDDGYFRIKRYEIAAGRTFTAQEVRTGAPVVVIGDLLRERFFPGREPVGQQLVIAGLPYRITGVVAPQGTLFGISLDRFAAIPFTAPARQSLCAENVVHEYWGATDGPAALIRAVGEAEQYMRIARRLGPADANNFYIQTAAGALGTWAKISRLLMVALPGLVSIALVVGGIVIMNIMLVAVSERTREIGLRKALGARRRDILAQFLLEASTLSSLGAALGIGAGAVLAYVVQALTPLPAAIAPWSVGLAVVLGLAVGIAAGVYPAQRAARLDPVVALRAE